MGRLVLIPVPLGNLADLAPRSRTLLGQLEVVFCEDTRTTARLLAKLEISAPSMVPLHDHNERQKVANVLRRLEHGDVGLVSEAGTPVLSDPGFLVVRAAVEAGHEIVSVPGPNAAVCALVASGLPVDRFLFVGFPPRQPGKRRSWIESFSAETGSVVLYESPRRVIGTLWDLNSVLGARPCALAVNLSKRGERFCRGTLREVAEVLEQEEQVRGEMTLVVGGNADADQDVRWAAADRAIGVLLDAGTPAGAIRDAVCAALDLPRRDVYQRVLARQR